MYCGAKDRGSRTAERTSAAAAASESSGFAITVRISRSPPRVHEVRQLVIFPAASDVGEAPAHRSTDYVPVYVLRT